MYIWLPCTYGVKEMGIWSIRTKASLNVQGVVVCASESSHVSVGDCQKGRKSAGESNPPIVTQRCISLRNMRPFVEFQSFRP